MNKISEYIYIYIYIYNGKSAKISGESPLYREVLSYRLETCYTSILNHFIFHLLSNHPGLIVSHN
jgi:hypothetical protein